jgi:hypothetical protein
MKLGTFQLKKRFDPIKKMDCFLKIKFNIVAFKDIKQKNAEMEKFEF